MDDTIDPLNVNKIKDTVIPVEIGSMSIKIILIMQSKNASFKTVWNHSLLLSVWKHAKLQIYKSLKTAFAKEMCGLLIRNSILFKTSQAIPFATMQLQLIFQKVEILVVVTIATDLRCCLVIMVTPIYYSFAH